MYIHSVKLTNFKSIGDYPESEIILEPKVTAIIGKNESGKSNILDGLSRIRFRMRNNAAFTADIVNRSCVDGQENEYVITLKSTDEEKILGITDDTTVKITKNSFEATGGILSYFFQMVQSELNTIIEILGAPGSNPMQLRDQDWTKFQMYYNELRATHSPYMLNLETDGFHRIRAVVKNAEGFTYVYKTAYDSRIAPDSQQDTLAPIINAIGMNLNDTFGPAKDKINIVTEGMSDYIYLCTMAKVLGIDTNKYAIIPSVGAPNCINICSILHGWGCRYIAVFDYDTAGVKTGGEYLRKEMMFEYKRQYCYLADVSQENVDQKTYKTSPYMIEDVVTREEINRYCTETNTSSTIGKTLMAKLMSNDIELGTYQLGEESKSNFEALFNRIFSCFEE